MNLPENLSAAATSLYNIISANPSLQTAEQLTAAYSQKPIAEEPKAIATANSLVIKGIIGRSGAGEEVMYALTETPAEENPDKVFTGDGYVEGGGNPETNDANAEEQRMIDLLKKNNKKLPEPKLFELYDQEQQLHSETDISAADKDVEGALKELTNAGVVSKDGDNYSLKR